MKTLSIDIETYSSVSLQKAGVYRYVEAPDFEILLFGYSADGAPVQVIDLACGEKIPSEILDALTDDAVTKWAFNANFERICLSQHMKALGLWQKVVTTYASGASRSDIELTSWYEATALAFEKSNTLKEYVDDSDELVRSYAESIMQQKADEIQISISAVTGTLTTDIQDTKDSLAETNEALSGSLETLSQRVSDQEDALLDYKHETSTYFRFNATGLNIGKQEDGDESPYSINIDNEKMAFLQNGNEIAYVQYNKMHINAIEAMDRMSVGAAADGGYFDFISTIYGMGVKWRAVTQGETTAKAAAKLMARRPAAYVPVQDDEGIFTVDFGGDSE